MSLLVKIKKFIRYDRIVDFFTKISGSERFLIIKPLFRNKYFLTCAGFFIWITFIDDSSLRKSFSIQQDSRELKSQIIQLNNDIQKINSDLKELTSNDENLEKFAREEYLMKKPDEDLYIVVE